MIIIIVTFIIQSLIISLYYGVTHSALYYFLLFDILLLFGLAGQKVLVILLIASLCLQSEIMEDQNIKGFYLSMRFVLSITILQEQQKLILLVFSIFYFLFRTVFYLQPLTYFTIIGYLVVFLRSYYQQYRVTSPVKNQNQQLLRFFEECLPLPICIIQNEQLVFTTKQFKLDYDGLTPSTIKYITSKSNKECLATYLNKRKPQDNIQYECYNKKKLEFCTLEYQGDPHLETLFPTDIDVAEVIWEFKPAIMLIFQSQKEKQNLETIKELQLRDQYKDEMLASISHDFKTPINGMVAIVSYLEQIVIDQNEMSYLVILRKWAQLLLFMISDILDFSRIQKNTLRLTNTTFYIRTIVQEIIDLISLQANQKGIIVEKNITFGDRLMYSDPNRIKQILLNLLSNSLKFTEKGKIDIVVDYKNTDGASCQSKLITISVADTGVGIPDNVKPKLFKMYGTFDFTNNGSNKHGIGLGLVICKKLVGLLGPTDSIELVSQVGVGSRFSFDIYINNDQRNSPSIHQKEITNLYKQDTKISTNSDQQNNQLITSQFTIFNNSQQSSTLTAMQQKKINKKVFTQTFQDIPEKKVPHSAYQFRTFQRKKTKKKSLIRKDNKQDMMSVEDNDQSKCKNIELYLELHSEVTYASQLIKNKLPYNNSPTYTPVARNDSGESPAIQRRPMPQPQQFTGSIDDMMKLLFPEPCSILVVDDSAVNVFAFRLILQKYDQITIDEAYNGEQAIQKIKTYNINHQTYQYIFMDLTMPIMNGYEATEAIRQMEKNKLIQKSYIIALTGYDDLKEKEKCQQLGFDAFVSKPLRIVDIISVVNEVKNTKDALNQ